MYAIGFRLESTCVPRDVTPAVQPADPIPAGVTVPGQQGQTEYPFPAAIAHSSTPSRTAFGSLSVSSLDTRTPVNTPRKWPGGTASTVNSPCSSRPGIADRAITNPSRCVPVPRGKNNASAAPSPVGSVALLARATRCARAAAWIRASRPRTVGGAVYDPPRSVATGSPSPAASSGPVGSLPASPPAIPACSAARTARSAPLAALSRAFALACDARPARRVLSRRSRPAHSAH